MIVSFNPAYHASATVKIHLNIGLFHLTRYRFRTERLMKFELNIVQSKEIPLYSLIVSGRHRHL